MTDATNSYAKRFQATANNLYEELLLLAGRAEDDVEKAQQGSETDLMDLYAVIYSCHKDLEYALENLSKVKINLQENIIPKLLEEKDEFGMSSGYRGNKSEAFGYNLHVRVEQYPSLADQETGFQFLKERGYENAIKPTVHAQTLRSIYTELCKTEQEIPEGVFKVATKIRAIPLKARS